MSEIYDIAILGAGPAGISAAIYAARAGMNILWLDKQFAPGGQVINTYEVDNYPGMPGITGTDLGEAMGNHAERLGIAPVRENVLSVELSGDVRIIRAKKHEYRARTLVLACGASRRTLGVPGEAELCGMGVSYCAACDGAFFKGKTAAVIGGGNTAVEDAVFLSRLCKKVYLVHRRGELRADKIIQDSLLACDNVEIIWDTAVAEIQGTDMVTGVKLQNVKTGEFKLLETDGVFVAIGIIPNTEKFRNLVELDEGGYIIAGEEGLTNVPGVFAAGDIRTKSLRQVVTAVADGANAATSAQNYLMRLKK